MASTLQAWREQIARRVDRRRLLATAVELIAEASPTGQAGAAADRLSDRLEAEGFTVERPAARHPTAPAVVVRWGASHPRRRLQFAGHLDTVHLPFVPPAVTDGILTGSGACDMKGGLAAAIEALCVLRDMDVSDDAGLLLVAYDLHEAPWGYGEQLDALIDAGIVGDAVLLPEPLWDRLAVVGRGNAVWKARIERDGESVHEVAAGADAPHVIALGGELIARLGQWNRELAAHGDPLAGRETVFIGQFHAGEIYNQSPKHAWLEGTRRWLPATAAAEIEPEFRRRLETFAREAGVRIEGELRVIRDAFALDEADPIVPAFQAAYHAVCGSRLERGAKPFVDDGNTFSRRAAIAAITHGPRSGGQHTVHEWVPVDELERVAQVYALTALAYGHPLG